VFQLRFFKLSVRRSGTIDAQVMSQAGADRESRRRCHHKRTYNTQGWKRILLSVDLDRPRYHAFKELIITGVDSPSLARPHPDINRYRFKIEEGCPRQRRKAWFPSIIFEKRPRLMERPHVKLPVHAFQTKSPEPCLSFRDGTEPLSQRIETRVRDNDVDVARPSETPIL
jgi:hypothetical protein